MTGKTPPLTGAQENAVRRIVRAELDKAARAAVRELRELVARRDQIMARALRGRGRER